jgi:hypothetical protein
MLVWYLMAFKDWGGLTAPRTVVKNRIHQDRHEEEKTNSQGATP